jgi:phosphatidylinositol-4,5-bisphosphate 3-kinase catalytic subunit alpha/beta/delta
MLTFDGRLFHIDFGHFLGHYKKKLGMDREKAPFVFTPQFAHVLGRKNSPHYKEFEALAAAAYNIVRRNGNLFVSLFSLMLSVGLDELQSVDNIAFLRDRIQSSLNEDAAADLFQKLIDSSLATTRQQMMDVVHILAN